MDEWGFKAGLPVAGRYSIADLIPKSRNRCGVYWIEFTDGLAYIGQAVDVVRRFAQHRKLHDNMTVFRFRSVRRERLDAVEQDLIHRAENAGIRLANRIHVAQVQGDSDLDALIDPSDQGLWRREGIPPSLDLPRVRISLEERYRARGCHLFQRLQLSPVFGNTVSALQTYVKRCILAPLQTEFTFWSVSCVPSTNRSTWPRLAAVNLNLMETLVIGHRKRQPTEVWALVNVARSELLADQTEEAFRALHPGVRLEVIDYVAAGHDQATLQAADLAALMGLLKDPMVLRAARLLSLRLMRKGANMYARSHCFDLADRILA